MVTLPLWCGEVLGMVAPPCGRMRCGRRRFDSGIAGCLDGCVTLWLGEVGSVEV